MPYKDPQKRKENCNKWYLNNPEKAKANSLKWKKNNPDKVKASNAAYRSRPENILKKKRNSYKRNYNATDEQFDAYMAVTHCQVCDRELSNDANEVTGRCQDHCHITGKMRKVLCNRCNTAEGYYKDDPESILKLYEYIKQNTSK